MQDIPSGTELTVALCCAAAFGTAQRCAAYKKYSSYDRGNIPDDEKYVSYVVGNLMYLV
ncbi:MAG: hypothetical protein LBD91_06200 [Prevotellaceae bacterium]|nr:hypothetical protein [Prevotellaceae bacterium]